MHKSGFVNIIGATNVGKSTLLNVLLGEELFIVTPKAQTTRRRITGIYNDEEHQIVFSDTPGYISEPRYELHRSMNKMSEETFEDADILIYVTEPAAEDSKDSALLLERLKNFKQPLLILINKMDKSKNSELDKIFSKHKKIFPDARILPVSALHCYNTEKIIPFIKENLKEHPPFYPKDDLSDKNIRFFVSEIIRKNLLKLYSREIPYASEIVIDEFKEHKDKNYIKAIIYAERETQKMIILGKKGEAIKKLGIQSRLEIEEFTQRSTYLELGVKILKNWRNDKNILKKFGFQQ